MTHGSGTREFEAFLSGHKPLPTPATFRDGELLGDWRLTAFLGKGGSGEVYRAEHVRDSRTVALKVRIRRSGKSDSQADSGRVRFEREARILSGNAYSFFPRFYEFGEASGHLYFTMELLEPISLPNTDAAIESFLLELCRAVRVLHGNGLVHRDIKPQNIMRRANGQLVLIDLGLVKESAFSADHTGASVTTVDGKAVGVGTPRYAAPEQFNGGAISPATDIHALGMLADECFGGRPPREWERIISRSTSSIPERRYADIDAFTKAIRRRHSRRMAVWCIVVAAMGTFAAFAWYGIAGRARTPSAPHFRQTWQSLAEDVQTNVVARRLVYEKLVTNDFGTVMCTERAWRTVTNVERRTMIRLDRRRHTFAAPMVLETNRTYWIVGPGTLDVSLDGKPGATVGLDNCVLLNRTTNTLAACGVRYMFRKGSYLNFTAQKRADNDGYRAFVEGFDGADNALEFQGPETPQALQERRDGETRRLLENENR